MIIYENFVEFFAYHLYNLEAGIASFEWWLLPGSDSPDAFDDNGLNRIALSSLMVESCLQNSFFDIIWIW